jgi:precorrin-6B methylase 2
MGKMSYKLSNADIEKGIALLLKDKPEQLSACIDAIYNDLEGYEAMEEFHRKYMTPSLGVITVANKERVIKLLKELTPHIYQKTVIEIGAGVGLLALGMANIAKEVYAIEVDPAWSWAFTKILYELKKPNLTFIFGKAETMIGKLHGDIAVIVTRSGIEEMKSIGHKLADKVIMQLQDDEIGLSEKIAPKTTSENDDKKGC